MTNSINEEFIEKVKEYMSNNNLKQYELANLLGTSDAQVNRWIRGRNKVSKAWRIVISNRLGF